VTDLQAFEPAQVSGQSGVIHDAVEALIALGFPRRDVERIVRQVSEQLTGSFDSGAVVRESLRHF
jgi:Holliday junction resolvasome RuvABC DNA-binding subunit